MYSTVKLSIKGIQFSLIGGFHKVVKKGFMSLRCTLEIIVQSQRHAEEGNINRARNLGVCAAYLNVAAITIALVVACVTIGLVFGLSYF